MKIFNTERGKGFYLQSGNAVKYVVQREFWTAAGLGGRSVRVQGYFYMLHDQPLAHHTLYYWFRNFDSLNFNFLYRMSTQNVAY